MLRGKKGWPKLKCKGAPVRAMDKFALELAETHLDERQVMICKLMVRFNEIIDVEPMFLSADAKVEIAQLGLCFGNLYTTLASNANARRLKQWKVTPKLHIFLHMCEWQAVEDGNPRHNWTYSDEDFVGKCILIAENCHPSTVCVTAMWKWHLGVFDLRAREID